MNPNLRKKILSNRLQAQKKTQSMGQVLAKKRPITTQPINPIQTMPVGQPKRIAY